MQNVDMSKLPNDAPCSPTLSTSKCGKVVETMWNISSIKKAKPQGPGVPSFTAPSIPGTGPRSKYPPLIFTRCLDRQAAALLFEYGIGSGASWVQRRDGLVVRTLLSTGLRRAELASLNECNIHRWGNQNWLYLVGKGKRERWIPLHTSLISERRNLFADISSRFSRPSKLPFIPALCGKRVQPASSRTIYAAVERATVSALGNRVSPHILRHTCASIMLATRAPLPGVQGILGHSDLRTTARYLHLMPETLLAATSAAFYEALGIEAGIYHSQQCIRFVGGAEQ